MASVMRGQFAGWSSGFQASSFRGCAVGVKQHHQQVHHHRPANNNTIVSSPIFTAVAYPCNPSLEDELSRLFADFRSSHIAKQSEHGNEVWNEFKTNGLDTEYVPDTENFCLTPNNKKKNKKPLPSECVFCKNNGEDQKIYKDHLLKDIDGRILCPILRKYTCPICGASGDDSHTIKYCPKNKHPQPLASMNALKSLRNSTGRRRSK
ncbi:hypothetical protein QAD02_008762 [Eretmocerus hayati]|uniref:Uncharacterized protein n=1 Tax=Eretmocerus hayati TaxID=131215 RepID=A0ACC2N7E9_9HYME|nr:hypothetical protein QAD02_008762 [Eretmocerus hayati]